MTSQRISRCRPVVMVGSILATMGLAVLAQIAPARATVPGSNGKIVFQSNRTGNLEIYTVNPDGTGLSNLTNNPADDSWPAWSPDGTMIAFASQRNPSGIYIMNADGTNAHRVANWAIFLSWSGDGSKLAFASRTDSNFHIFTVNVDGSVQQQLTNSPVNDDFPSWSPDGKRIVFRRTGDPSAGLYVMNADGTNPVRLTDDSSGIDQAPSFSPDGNKIVFNRAAPPPNSNNSGQLWVMDADGSNQAQLTNLSGYNAYARYSADGRGIVFQQSATTSDGPFHLVTMNVDGTGVQNRTNTSFDDEFPDLETLSPRGMVLDGWGGVHPFGGAPAVTVTDYWQGWDIARGIADHNVTSGYVLDGWGGIHPYGGAPAVGITDYWQGWDIARAIAIDPADPNAQSGYVLDGWGGVHPFGGAPAVTISSYWQGWDIARGIIMNPRSPSQNYVTGYVLDGWGGIHAFWQTGSTAISSPAPGDYWPGWNIARGIVSSGVGQGYVLDGWGGMHPFGGAPPVTTSAYWQGWDVARGVTYVPSLHGGYVVDGWGAVHEYGGAPYVPHGDYWWGWDIARGAAG